ncbi:alpha/beta-hydrolase [Whalleya microplaca]|nr:alpha/beta-hydrolase [Whalleya microplaca]
MAPILSKQPFKTLYLVFFVFRLLPLLLLLSIRYSLRVFRPIREWSFTICLANALGKQIFQYLTVTRTTLLNTAQSGHAKAGDRFALASPAEPSVYTGILTPRTTQPAAVGGLRYPSPPPPVVDSKPGRQKVLLHFPAGAFVLAFGFDHTGQTIADVMAQHMKATRTFYPQYRVSTSPETRFPAALQDALTAYLHVLSLGMHPKDVILSGDSTGGSLVLALLRYLEASPSPRHPLPGGAIAWYPWVHVTASAGRDYKRCRNADGDGLTAPLLQWGADAYLPAPGTPLAREAVPYVSPLHHPFQTSVPLFLHAGTGEAFYGWVRSFAREMAEVNGERGVRFHQTELAPHGLLTAARTLGMTSQLRAAVEDACGFFEESK